jgi:hypothetical protein
MFEEPSDSFYLILAQICPVGDSQGIFQFGNPDAKLMQSGFRRFAVAVLQRRLDIFQEEDDFFPAGQTADIKLIGVPR